MRTFQQWLVEVAGLSPMQVTNDGMPCRSKISAQDRPSNRAWNGPKKKTTDPPPEQHPEPEDLFGFRDGPTPRQEPERVQRMMSKKMKKG